MATMFNSSSQSAYGVEAGVDIVAVGAVLYLITTLSVDEHPLFVIVQVSVLFPEPNVEIVALYVLLLGENTPEPLEIVQVPVPTLGLFADNSKLPLQVVPSEPAFAVVGV